MTQKQPGDTADAFRDPKQKRRERKRLASQWLADAIRQSGVCKTVIAALLGKSRAALARELDEDDEDAPVQCETVIGLPPEARQLVADELCALDGRIPVKLPDFDQNPKGSMQGHARLARESAELIAAHAEAIADGRLTANEAESVRKEADELLRTVLSIRLLCDHAEHERVIQLVREAQPRAKGG